MPSTTFVSQELVGKMQTKIMEQLGELFPKNAPQKPLLLYIAKEKYEHI